MAKTKISTKKPTTKNVSKKKPVAKKATVKKAVVKKVATKKPAIKKQVRKKTTTARKKSVKQPTTDRYHVLLLHYLPRAATFAVTAIWGLYIVYSNDVSIHLFFETMLWMFLVMATVIAWRWEILGGLLFFGIGLAYFATQWFSAPLLSIMFIGTMLILTGLLFISGRMHHSHGDFDVNVKSYFRKHT
jgi:hypothetical protein